jgi:hypothetical protein
MRRILTLVGTLLGGVCVCERPAKTKMRHHLGKKEKESDRWTSGGKGKEGREGREGTGGVQEEKKGKQVGRKVGGMGRDGSL